jgi:trk system potassium uptake protein TrkA
MRQQFLVVGLGRFGSNVARTLVSLGQEVLGLDIDGRRVEAMKGDLTHVAEGDAADPQVLQAIDIEQFEGAVVAISGNFEASVLTTLALVQAKAPYVMATARSAEAARALGLIGAHHVMFPEADAGEVAGYHLINRHLVDFLRLDDRTTVAAVEMGNWAGKSLH